ncbi:MAG: hypothetical protein J0I40_14990 [Cellulomonas sp.]|uniref:hypothetical protein n=1 Tax=Cellulomonas sp. 73-92 TaxID=1895740 RepID=UPI001ACEE467|nr:hypothetical protein [Cellulomonas sp. 73-92]MBN9376661.1 hypothetical protein [Cellulomonas sp.]
MSALERRLQVLVDEQRFALLETESRRTGRSVGAIVRGAIDDHFAVADIAAQRAAAIEWLLARPAGDGPDWSDTKKALDAEIEARLG